MNQFKKERDAEHLFLFSEHQHPVQPMEIKQIPCKMRMFVGKIYINTVEQFLVIYLLGPTAIALGINLIKIFPEFVDAGTKRTNLLVDIITLLLIFL